MSCRGTRANPLNEGVEHVDAIRAGPSEAQQQNVAEEAVLEAQGEFENEEGAGDEDFEPEVDAQGEISDNKTRSGTDEHVLTPPASLGTALTEISRHSRLLCS